MKKNFLKSVVSLALVTVMMLSAMVVSVSAATEVSYDITVYKAQGDGRTNDIERMTVVGENGEFSVYLSHANNSNVNKITGLKHEDIGEIKEIQVKNYGADGSYIKYVTITANGKTTTIYGGEWHDDSKTVTYKPSDNVIKFVIKTSDVEDADTDERVYLKLTDEFGNEFTTTDINEFFDSSNRGGSEYGLERGKTSIVYVRVPDYFGKLVSIEPIVKTYILDIGGDWHLSYINATNVSGANKGDYNSFGFYRWIECD